MGIPEGIPAETSVAQREKIAEEAFAMGKPEDTTRRIVEGRTGRWASARAPLTQGYVKEPNKTVGDLLRDTQKCLAGASAAARDIP